MINHEAAVHAQVAQDPSTYAAVTDSAVRLHGSGLVFATRTSQRPRPGRGH